MHSPTPTGATSRTDGNRTMMTTLLQEEIHAGDVIEVKTIASADDVTTVLVLLANEHFLILDPCDGSTPFVVQSDELVEYRKFADAA